ncbi:MAG TPA: DoxX family protein [Ktedonobacterales bacterium]|nr:DoxX family protein [Ktedonobacterales bacterium]
MANLKQLAYLLLSVIFIQGGYRAYTNPGHRVEEAAAIGVPEPELAVKANGLTMVIAGAMLGLGIFPKLAAAALFASLIPTTIAGHPFWKEEDEARRSQQQTQFAKNLGLLGGLLLVMVDRKSRS